MDVRHNLIDIYERVQKESVNYLIDKYQAKVIKENGEKHKYPVILEILVIVAGFNIKLLINLPFNFPDSFPKFKLEESSFNTLYPLPHLDTSKTLCLFDEVLASPNPNNPFGILDSSIDKARDILSAGILKQNLNEYTEEFKTYWLQESKDFYLSIVEPSVTAKEIFFIPFNFPNWLQKGLLADTQSAAIKWVQNLGGSINTEEFEKVLYIPLAEPLLFPFPNTNRDIYQLLKGKKSALQALSNYLTKFKRPSKVLFSIKSEGEYTWGIWEHIEPFKRTVSHYKGKRKIQTSLKGFRKGTQHGWLELAKDFSNMEVNKYSIEDVRSTRLKKRGGDGKTENHELKVAVVGCGAVGSHIAQGLIDIGIENLFLIDPDKLNFENINRHLCGASDVGQPKPEVVKNKLRKHHPTSKIDVYNGNVLSLLTTTPKALNSYDLIIVAISHLPTELRLNELQTSGIINKPILNLWIEPYLAGGHAIWFNPEDKISISSLFKDNGEYKNQVLRNGNAYTKKELGCNTSYVPYGVLELKKFINDIILFTGQQLNDSNRKSKTVIWLGNLTDQKRHKRLLAPKWLGATDFSLRVKNIENNQESVD
ncbi:E2/UBC family protein B [Bacillus sp. BK006]|nr:E2/UBC family protein B [Bacillus sp. BK006]